MKKKVKNADIVVVGGGAAGCFAAVTAKKKNPDLDVIIVEKAHIERSGCLAAGINAINAYITEDETPRSYLNYVKNDSNNLVRDDLVYTIGQNVNRVTKEVEDWGLPILKDDNGNYIARSSRSIKINGENFKPILASKVNEMNIEVINRTVATNYIVDGNRVKGCFAFNIRENIFYIINAKAVICATGGASGIYKPNNPGKAKHKMWYPPFNTGSGYAMGLRAGAEMTTFEMRFVALRVKDVIAPTGSFAFAGARQINNEGEEYLNKHDKTNTCMRLYATVQEEKAGKGPCYLDLSHLDKEKGKKLYQSLLDMSPDMILKWEEMGVEPDNIKVKIEGTEPYIVGGHCQSGYWVDVNRKTTLEGLYAAGDVAGGAPKKYVSGAFVEGEFAAKAAINHLNNIDESNIFNKNDNIVKNEYKRIKKYLNTKQEIKPDILEDKLQKIMEDYAGGKKNFYEMKEKSLLKAKNKLNNMEKELDKMKANNLNQLMAVHEVLDRYLVAKVLVEHLRYRKETRWPGYQTRIDYPEKKEKWRKFINSRFENEKIKMLERQYKPLVNYSYFKD